MIHVFLRTIQKITLLVMPNERRVKVESLLLKEVDALMLKKHSYEHCIFCGKTCKVEKDPKHLDRWEEAYLCRTSNKENLGREQTVQTDNK